MFISDTDKMIVLSFFAALIFGGPVLIGMIVVGTEMCFKIQSIFNRK